MSAPVGPLGPKEFVTQVLPAAEESKSQTGNESVSKALGKSWKKVFISGMKSAWNWIKASYLFRSIFGSKASPSNPPAPLTNRVSVVTAETVSDSAATTSETALSKLGITPNPQTKGELEQAIAKLVERNRDLNMQLEHLNNQKDKVSVLEKEIDEAQKQINDKESQIEALLTLYQKAKSEAKEGKDVSTQLNNFQLGINTLTGDIAKLKEKIKKNTKASWDPQEMADGRKAEISRNNQIIERLRAQKAKLEPPVAEGKIPKTDEGKNEESITAQVSDNIVVDQPIINAQPHEVKTQEEAPSSIDEPVIIAEAQNLVETAEERISRLTNETRNLTALQGSKQIEIANLRKNIEGVSSKIRREHRILDRTKEAKVEFERQFGLIEKQIAKEIELNSERRQIAQELDTYPPSASYEREIGKLKGRDIVAIKEKIEELELELAHVSAKIAIEAKSAKKPGDTQNEIRKNLSNDIADLKELIPIALKHRLNQIEDALNIRDEQFTEARHIKDQIKEYSDRDAANRQELNDFTTALVSASAELEAINNQINAISAELLKGRNSILEQ